MSGGSGILMVTDNRPAYTRLSLARLLETCDESMRVWVWHNGNHAETLEVVRSFEKHPRMHLLHHSPENVRLRGPTNWFWSRATGAYVSKVDDDNLMPDGWAATLRAAHEAEPRLGVIGCWPFRPEDHRPELAAKKVIELPGGHRLLKNCWIAGTGHLIKRRCLEDGGSPERSEGSHREAALCRSRSARVGILSEAEDLVAKQRHAAR